MEHFCPKRLRAEGLWGGLLYWRPWKIYKERLRIRAFPYIGVPYQEGGS
jgi:hypothetical protein